MIDLNKPLELVDYTVTPLEFVHDENAWQVKLLTGDHKGKNLVFTGIEYDGNKQTLRFLLDVLDLDNNLEPTSADLEDYAFEILQDIIKKGIADGSIILNDKDSSN
jgi:hypothetical protein